MSSVWSFSGHSPILVWSFHWAPETGLRFDTSVTQSYLPRTAFLNLNGVCPTYRRNCSENALWS
jgi:hypothetical protein